MFIPACSCYTLSQIYFSQHQTAFNILIHKPPVGVKKLFFLFLCDLQAQNLMLNYQVKMEVEIRGSICFDIRHIQDIVYNN